MQTTFPTQIGSAQDVKDLRRTLAGKAFLAVGATAFVALCAHISFPLYFTPVPVTLQTLAVILVGIMLGPSLGFSAMMLYLAEGAMGLPVFSPHSPGGMIHLLGPTAGYLFSYPLAAAAAGAVVRAVRLGQSKFPAAVLAGISASVVTFAMGAAWIACLPHSNAGTAWHLGVVPFLPGEALKIAAAAGAYATQHRGQRS
jgi:biotin transport system substrate-specific component